MQTNPVVLDQLTPPPIVAEMLERLAPPADQRDFWEREYTLSYYYGGLVVAAEPTAGGLVVVASGPAGTLGPALDKLPRDRAGRLVFITPDPLADHLDALPQGREAVVG